MAIKLIYTAVLNIVMIFILYTYLFAQSIGYNQIILGAKYNSIKDILRYQEYIFNELNIGIIKVITYHDAQSQGMLVFDYFDRLYTVIVTIPITDVHYEQLYQHLKRKYGEFKQNKDILTCTIGMYYISLYHNKTAKTATVEYGHTIPLFFTKEPMAENPFSQF